MKKNLTIKFLLLFVFLSFPIFQSQAATTGKVDEAYTFYLKALLQESQGNLSGAQAELEKALALAPESGYLYRMGAELAFRQAQLPKAQEMVEKALRYDPENPKLYILAGQIYWGSGDTEKAEEKLKRALELEPDESEALVNLAMAVTPKDPQRAIKLYLDYLDRHPTEIEIQERVAQLYQGLGDIPKAKEAWAKTLELSPDSLRAHLASAQLAEVDHDTATAISHYQAVLEQDPTNLPLLLRVGELRYRNDEMAEANEAFSKARSIAPDSASANFWLALLSEHRGDWDEAIRLLLQVAAKAPDPAVMLRLSYYYSQAGKQKEAIKVLEGLCKDEPENTDFLNYLSIAYEQDHQYSKAIKTMEKLILIDNENPEPRFHLATIYDRTKNFKEAEVQLKKAIELNPDFHVALNYLGYSYAERSVNLDEAEKLLNKAVALSPHNGAYLDSIGWLSFRQKKYQQAERFLVEAVQKNKDPLIYIHLAEVRLAQNNLLGALQAYDQSLRLGPDQKDVMKKWKDLLKKISPIERISFFMNRTEENYKALQELKGLVEIQVCEKGPCYKVNGQMSYEKGQELRVEIPGPLGGPALLLIKPHGSAAKYGTLHPMFQSIEPYVTRAIDRIETLFSGDIFKSINANTLEKKIQLSQGMLSSQSSDIEINFDDTNGVLKVLKWEKDQTRDHLRLAPYFPGRYPSVPQSLEWEDKTSGFILKIKFINPVLTSAIQPQNNNDDDEDQE